MTFSPPPNPDQKPRTASEAFLAALFILCLGWLAWTYGGYVVMGFVTLCMVFPVIPAVICFGLIALFPMWAWDSNQRWLIRGELEKFHNRRR